MLTGVDRVDWSALEHAYGPATDVPRHLRALGSVDSGVREAALDALYGNLWHQGTLYPATAAAVPFVLDLVDDDATPERPLLLLFLADVGRSASFGDDPWYGDTLAALKAGVRLLERRLSSPDEVERISATVALAWADDGDVLSARLASGDEGERLVTLYALVAGREAPAPALLQPYADATEGPLRLAARIGLVRAGQPKALGTVDTEAYVTLAEVAATVAPQALPQPAELLDPATLEPASIRTLCHVLASSTGHRTALPLVELLLSAVFPDGYEEPPTTLQTNVLTAIANSRGAWVYVANTTAALAEQGLEVLDRSDLCARLGVALPEAPDRDDTATLLQSSESTGMRYEELSRDQRDLLERFVDRLDALGWNETRNWHKFVTSGSGYAISPIGVGRHYNDRAVLECTLWLFDEHVAADTGERTGDPYVRLMLADKAEAQDPIGFRAYLRPGRAPLDAVLDVMDKHRPTLDRDNFGERFLHDLFAVTPRVEVELADGRVVEIRPKRSSGSLPDGEAEDV
jgi:hypothetical protein